VLGFFGDQHPSRFGTPNQLRASGFDVTLGVQFGHRDLSLILTPASATFSTVSRSSPDDQHIKP